MVYLIYMPGTKYNFSTRRVNFGLDFLLLFEPKFFFLIKEIPQTFIKKLAIISEKHTMEV